MSLILPRHYRPVIASGPADPNFADVILLIQPSGADGSTTFTDLSSYGHTVTTIGGAQVDTGNQQSGFGPSMLLNGTNAGLRIDPPNTTTFAFGTGDFTIEMFVYINGNVNTPDADMLFGWGSLHGLQVFNQSNILYLFGGGGVQYSMPGTYGTWFHLAVVRNSGTASMYINGTSAGSVANTTNLTSASNLPTIGYLNNAYYTAGAMHNIRMTKGVARYTANFTAPTEPFPTR